MIGDSYEADILGALNAGMHAIHFDTDQKTKHNDCLIIDDLNELLKIL